ncbi:MAG: hypothetical protein OXH14_17260, partial [Alphaproteobacteria bacterium]|nr:hypothetical protein [Alphaproteobacteria bacterium]
MLTAGRAPAGRGGASSNTRSIRPRRQASRRRTCRLDRQSLLPPTPEGAVMLHKVTGRATKCGPSAISAIAGV